MLESADADLTFGTGQRVKHRHFVPSDVEAEFDPIALPSNM
jgi:hypothetical protein